MTPQETGAHETKKFLALRIFGPEKSKKSGDFSRK